MKLGKLTIKNLASIADATVDFESSPLSDVALFLICGDTGSGKTTLLDAICLALYGQTPRYLDENKKGDEVSGFKQNDPLQLVRRGTTEAYVKLSLTGNDGKPYEAKWEVSFYERGPKKGTAKKKAWEWKDLSPDGLLHTNQYNHLKTELLPAAIGLDFDQFCRTTLLAQGQFTKFLLSDDDDKAAILEKLTNTERFSKIGQKIFEVSSEKNEVVRQLKDTLSRLGGLGEDVRKQKENELKEVKTEAESARGLKDAVDAKINWLFALEAAANTLREKEEELNACKKESQSESFLADRKNVEDWDLSHDVLDELRKVRKAEECIAKQQSVLDEARRDYADRKGNLAWLESEWKSVGEKLEKIRQELDIDEPTAKMYKDCEVIVATLADIGKAEAALADAMRKEADEKKKKQELAEKKKAAEESLNEARNATESAAKALDGKKEEREAIDIAALRAREQSLTARKGEIRLTADMLHSLETGSRELAQRENSLKSKKDDLERTTKQIPALEADAKSKKDAYDAAEKHYSEVNDQVQNGIEKLVATLREGDECPICGSLIKKLPQAGFFDALLRSSRNDRDEKKNAWTTAAQVWNNARSTLAERQKLIDEEQLRISELQTKLAKEKDELSAACTGLKISEVSESTLTAAAENCGKRLAEIGSEISRYDSLTREITNLQSAKNACDKTENERQQAIFAIENKITASTGEIEGLRRLAEEKDSLAKDKLAEANARIPLPCWENIWRANAKDFAADLKRKAGDYTAKLTEQEQLVLLCNNLEKDCSSARDAISAIAERCPEWESETTGTVVENKSLLKDLNSLSGAVISALSGLARAQTDREVGEKACGDFVAGHGGWTHERLAELASLDILPVRQRVNQAESELKRKEGAVGTARESYETQAKKRPADWQESDTLESLSAAKDEIVKHMENLDGKTAELSAELKTDDKTAENRKGTEKELKAANEEMGKWNTLNNLFGDKEGKKIRRVIQSYVLKNVLVQANRFLKQLSDRYELSCVNLTLTVRDAYEGGIERPVKTLSGGEGFLVSLALALGLADMNDSGLAVDMLFIDEGFGTLSGEYLTAAMEALERLNALCGSRKVGVISHVEGLRERIKTHIEVRRNGHEPSTVHIIDNGHELPAMSS